MKLYPTVSQLGEQCFKDCAAVEKITSYSVTPPQCLDCALADIDKEACVLYVPYLAIDAYRAAPQWSEFENILPIEGVDSLEITTAEKVYRCFDLQGRQILTTTDRTKLQSLPAGIYIVNGKKLIVM